MGEDVSVNHQEAGSGPGVAGLSLLVPPGYQSLTLDTPTVLHAWFCSLFFSFVLFSLRTDLYSF